MTTLAVLLIGTCLFGFVPTILTLAGMVILANILLPIMEKQQ